MVIETGPVNIHHLIQIKYQEKKEDMKIKKKKNVFLLVMRTLRICSLKNFSTYHTGVLTTIDSTPI